MGEEEKNKKQGENEEEQLLTDQKDKVEEAVGQGVTMGLGFFKGKAKQAASALTKKAIAAIASFISSFSGFIIIALIVIIFVVSLLDIVANIFDFGPRDSTSIGNSQINEMFQINENGITMKNPDEMIKNVKKNLEEAGFRLESLGLGNEEQAKAYLFKFYQASMATQIPYIPTSEVKGIIRVKRTNSTVQQARELTWITHERFAQMLEAKDASLQNYYALDENWNLCVSTTIQTNQNGEETQTISEVKIPYQTVVSQYSVPFRYLMIMLQVTQNPEYIRYMCDMFVEGKQIDFTIFDSIQTTTDVHTYTYYTKVRERVEHTSYDAWDTEHQYPHTTYTMREKVSSSPTTETITSTTITNTITANITYANTWLTEITNEYTNESNTQYPLGEDGQTAELDDEEEPPKNEEGKWKINQTTNSKSTVTSNTWTQAGTNGQIKESEFLGLWKNETGTPQIGAAYDPNGKEVEYPVPSFYKKQSPLPRILTAEDFMFELLERYEDTQSYSDIMKYMLYKYTGKNYGVTSLDIDIFKRDDFKPFSSGGVIGGSFEDKVWFTLRNAGYSEEAVAGAMGSFYKESGFQSNNLENKGNRALGWSDEEYTAKVNSGEYTREQFCKDKHGYGLAQWTWHTRKAGLYDYVKQKGVGIEDENAQIEFLLQELSGKYPTWEQATTVEEAAEIFCRKFENPDMAVAHLSERIAKAKEYYERYKGKTAGNFENGSSVGVRCPRYYQSGQPWSTLPYNYKKGGTIASGGCGACALAMAVSGLTGMEVTPDVIVQHLNSIHRDTVNNAEPAVISVAQKYGLTYDKISRSNKASVDAALDQGKVLIFSIKPNGIYTGGGHFIACVGRDASGYYVLESGRYYTTDRPYAFHQVFSPGNQGVFVLGK